MTEIDRIKFFVNDREISEQEFQEQIVQSAELARLRIRLDKLSEALGVIAFADTHYPSTPSGFTGDWKTLRDFAREELQRLDPEGFAKWESYD